MNSKVKGALIFLAGAGLGGGTAWFITKKKYEKYIEEKINAEIESVRKTYNDLQKELVENNEKLKEEIMKYQISNQMHENDAEVEKDEPTEEVEDESLKKDKPLKKNRMSYNSNYSSINNLAPSKPYVISSEEYGEIEEYNIYNYVLYNNGILTDEADEPLDEDEIAARFGDTLAQFTDDIDAIYIRNDTRRTDYEIVKSPDNYI